MAAREPAQPERLGPHQRECLDAVCAEHAKGDRSIAFQMATGSGKTRVLLAIPGALRLARVVYVFPSLVLVQQFIAKDLGKEEYREAFPHYAVCSSEADAFKGAAACVPFDARLCAGDQYAVVTTYASLQQVLEAAFTADCVLFDEAHHAGADGCKKTMEAFAGCVVRASATLRAGEAPCHTYSLGKAIADNVCRDFNTYFFIKPKGDEKRLVEFLEGHRGATGNGRVMAFTQWSEAEGRSSGTNVNEFCKAHDEGIRALGGRLWSITAKDNKGVILDEFEKSPDDKLSVLVSCRTLSEGVDTETANVALFVDAVRSTTTIVQRIGRVTRVTRDKFRVPLPKEEQRPGSVIVNVYIDPAKYAGKSEAEVDELLAGGPDADGNPVQGDFSAIFGVMAALKETDPERYERAINFAAHQHSAADGAAGAADPVAAAAVGAASMAAVKSPAVKTAAVNSPAVGVPTAASKPPRPQIHLVIDPSLKLLLHLEGDLNSFSQKFEAKIEGGPSLEERSLARANEFKSFYEANERLPSAVAQTAAKRHNASPEQLSEHALARWFGDIKKAKRGKGAGKCYPSVDLLLTELLGPEWHMPEDLEAASLVRANEFKVFYEANKQIPRMIASTPVKRLQATPDQLNEQLLASWFGNMKKGKNSPKPGGMICYPSVDFLLTDLLGPEWHMPEDLEAAALARANAFKAFYEANGQPPATVAKTAVDLQKASTEQHNEHSLASWFNNMKHAKKGATSMTCYPSVDHLLSELLGPDWHLPVDLEAAALVRANEFKAFYEANGWLPIQVAQTAAKRLKASPAQLSEHALAQWFGFVKQAKGGKGAGKCYPSVDLLLTELLGPEWSTIRGKGQSQITAQSADNQPAAQPAASSSVAEVVASGTAEQAHAPVYTAPIAQATEPATKPARRAPKAKMSALPQEAAIAEPPATKPARHAPKAMTRAPPGPPQAADAAEPAGGGAPRALAEISALHKKYKSMRSDNLAALFREQPALWTEYHDIADANEAGFPADEVPHQRVAARLRAYFAQIPAGKPKTVVDLGCGRARLCGLFAGRPGLTFVNIDHVAGAAGITVADIAHTGLEAGAADVAVLCLALWGSNCDEYFAEAHRILDPGGRLIVVEPGERWRDAETGLSAHNLRDALARHGFAVAHEEVMAGGREQRFALFEAQKCAAHSVVPHSVAPHSVAPHSVAPPKLDHQRNGTPPLAGVVAANSWRILINGDLWDYEKYRADFNARPMPLFPQSKGRRHMVSLPRRGDSVSFVLGQKIVMKGTVASDKFEVGTAHQEDPYNKGERQGHAEPSEFAWIQIESVGLSIDIRRTGQSTWAKMPA